MKKEIRPNTEVADIGTIFNLPTTPPPECLCGSNMCGLVWITSQRIHQCGDCVNKVYELVKNEGLV